MSLFGTPDPGEDPGTALITGASAGIGLELARQFAAGGFDLALVARREERLREVGNAIQDDHGVAVTAVVRDLTEPDAAERLVDTLDDAGIAVSALVNNVGIGTYGRFVDSDLDRERNLLRLNVGVLTELTRLLLPRMVDRDRGYVLNVASLAGFAPGPKMATYYASKAYARSFSEALATELRDTGVSVTALCPGPVDTEFQRRAGMDDSAMGSLYKQSAESVARAGYEGVLAGDTVVVPGLVPGLMARIAGVAPRSVVRRVAQRINGDR